MKHEKKALNYPDGDIPTTNCEKEKRSRASRNVKVPYDPTSATDNQPRRGRLLFMSSDEEKTPRAPTPSFKKNPSSTIEKKKKILEGHIPMKREICRSSLLRVVNCCQCQRMKRKPLVILIHS